VTPVRTEASACSGAPTIFISAGEPSGDLHGAHLVRALRKRWPEARFLGLGGARMAAEGVELLADVSELAVMGFTEVLGRLPFFLKLRRRVLEAIERERVDLLIPIDYPGFNLRLAKAVRPRGVRVLYYIAPQVWAWHASRARDMARDTDHVAVILPFEADFLQRAGARASYVGHPLLDVAPPAATREAWDAAHGLDPARPVLGLFPGSRPQEIHRHLDLFVETAGRIVARRPEAQPVIARGPELPREAYAGVPYPLVESGQELLRHADAALVKSGTTTLEAALAGTPLVVAYRMSPLSYQIARRLVKVQHIALANLVAEERVAPEFVQDAATPEALAAALLPLLDAHSAERRRMLEGWERVQDALGAPGAAARVTEIAAELLCEAR
jgi:lipid-A-disaccharide synthase